MRLCKTVFGQNTLLVVAPRFEPETARVMSANVHAMLSVQFRLQIVIYFAFETSIMIVDRANQAFWSEARST